jgi:hypothetical protein
LAPHPGEAVALSLFLDGSAVPGIVNETQLRIDHVEALKRQV